MSQLHGAIETSTDDIIKPDTDKRSYRALKLKNEMKILLISDPDTDKSAAAMNVQIGHLSDPTDLPGLAHFCEHMMFLGSKKYPGENMYTDFISSHGGATNAFTGREDTNFHFDIAPAHFKEALDIFAQFFICPLFTESASDRELKAVHHENEKNKQNDHWRLHQLQQSLSNPGHDFHKFGTGNKLSLETIPKQKGINTRSELLNFHKKFYSSNLMSLAVLCKESLDEMTMYVCELFGNTMNKRVKKPSWPEHPYGPQQLRKRVHVVPIKDIRTLELLWPCDHLHKWWQSMPEHYLGHLIGHEGPGSLLSALKSRGWVNNICAGGKPGATGFSFITLNADLTEEGLVHVDDVITVAYEYIHMIRAAGPQQRIVQEGQDLNLMNFKFKDNEKPKSVVICAAEALRLYPLRETISGPHIWKTYEPDVIQALMDKLVPENMLSIVVSQSFAAKANKKEQWYGVDYCIDPHDVELEAKWREPEVNEALRLPEPNAFIPRNFEMCERDTNHSQVPRIIKNTALSRCWFKQDDEFLLPKGCMTLAIRSPLAVNSPLNANLTWLYLRLFDDAFAEHCYEAELTKLTYSLKTPHYGFVLNIAGYTDKLSVLLETIMSTLTTFTPEEKRVAVFREQYIRGLKNFKMAQPTMHADYRLGLLLKEGGWTIEELLECVDEMTMANLLSFIPQFFSRIYLETLVYGNFTVASALSLVQVVEDSLTSNMKSKPLAHSQQTRVRREAQLPDDSSYVYSGYNDIHSSSCVYNYYQLGLENTHNTMLLDLLHQIIRDPCFSTLRTKEQLGYMVYANTRRASGVQGLQIVVQSGKHPAYVDCRIEAFLASVEELLENLTTADYEKHVAGLITARLTKPKKLREQHARYWNEIVCENYLFDRDEIETDHVRTITQAQLVDFFKTQIAAQSKRRHKLSIYIIAKEHRSDFIPEGDEVDGYVKSDKLKEPFAIENHIDFKRGLQLFPLPKPAVDIPTITMSKL
ncbi:insulin-degrading enzyme-like [Watersipora subatra]|uniref:insulin-degrading enzyme-like n=1 Tax=Watersipora subatra TaxID=2589382 RepID=UPI00355C9102